MQQTLLILTIFFGLSYALSVPQVFDVVTAKPNDGCSRPGDGYDVVTQRCTHHLVQFSWNNKETFVIAGGEKLVMCPDEAECTSSSGSEGSSTVHIYDNIYAYSYSEIQSTSISASVVYNGINGSLAFSQQKNLAKQVFNDSQNSFSNAYYMENGFQMSLYDFPGYLKLNPVFASSIASLPPAYNSTTKAVYIDFIKGWGVAYLTYVFYGGLYNQTVIFSNEVYKQLSTQSVSTSISCSISINAKAYGIGLGVSYADAYNETKDYQIFKQNSVAPFDIYGGNGDAFMSGGREAWVPTLYNAWAVMTPYSQVAPIWHLITDPTIASCVQKAVNDYVNGNFD